jgi:hypothetical protein
MSFWIVREARSALRMVQRKNQRIENLLCFLSCFSKLFLLVDLVGIEPTTSSMPWKRAPSCATGPLFGRIAQTRDLLILAHAWSGVKPRRVLKASFLVELRTHSAVRIAFL